MQKKIRRNRVFLLCGILVAISMSVCWKSGVVAFSAENIKKDADYKSPVLLDENQSFTEKWYSKKPKLKLVHSEKRTVTKYCLISASGKKMEGILEMEEMTEPEQPEIPEIPEKPEISGEPEENEAEKKPKTEGLKFKFPWEGDEPEAPDEEKPEEEAKPVDKIFAPELLEEGVNTLKVWMELKEDQAKDEESISEKKESGKEVFRKEYQIKLDLSIPEKVIFQYPSNENEGMICSQTAITIGVEAKDKVSGIREVVYRLSDGEEKKISGEKGKIILPLGYQGNVTAYALDMAGNRGEKLVSRSVICEDEVPEVTIQTEGGFENWHTAAPEIQVQATDLARRYEVSTGIAKIVGYVDGEQVYNRSYGREENGLEKSCSFSVDKSSQGGKPVTVVVCVVDNAGNQAVKSEKLYIDIQNPGIQIVGIHEQQIMAEKMKAEIVVSEENCLQEGKITVVCTTPEKKKVQCLEQDLLLVSEKENKRIIPLEYEQDGRYEVFVTATDQAGHRTERKIDVTVDRTNPVIKYVNQMEGSYVPYFQWSYGSDEMIMDFTEYTYQMYFDGKNYFAGERKNTEGKHLLQVKAKDAAGNESSAEAVFTIDHTAPVIHWGELKSGESYEETVQLSVWVDQEGERLAEVRINGEKQKLSPNSQMYQCELIDSGTYNVKVFAEDLAGNACAEQMDFTVTEKKGIIKKMISPVVEPVKNLFMTEKEKEREMEETEEGEEPENRAVKIIGIMTMLLIFGSGCTVLIRKKCPCKREDAG